MFIQSLKEKLSTDLVGAKASSLSALFEYGFSVPNGYAVSKRVLEIYTKDKTLPDGFKQSLESCLVTLNSHKIIIRSSAIGEDSDSFSFAGQLDSFVVNNNTEEALIAIQNCWNGLNNDRVIAYAKLSGKKLIEMGVVIQEFVEADYAGVTFTSSPYNVDQVYTEYVKGAGEQLVSGKVTPENFSVNFTEIPKENLPFNGSELIRLATTLKEKYGYHIDIEWVSKGQHIFFVQARPITVLQKKKVHWTNTNLNENYPIPMSPLLYSIARDSYYHYFKNLAGLLQIHKKSLRTLEYDFSNTVGIWSNRLYYNMTSIHNILSSSPLKVYFKDAFNKFVGYSEKDVAQIDTSKSTSIIRFVFRLIRLNFSLEKHVRSIEKMVDDFAFKANSKDQSLPLSTLFYTFLDLRFNQWYHASLADFFSMIHYKVLGEITKKFYGKKSIGMHNTLVQAIPGLMSSEPLNETYDIVQEINKNSEIKTFFDSHLPKEVYQEIQENPNYSHLKKSLSSYLEKWGFRCSGELMFFSTNYIEEPTKFIELLQVYMSQDAQDPRKAIAIKDRERKLAMRNFAWKIIKKRSIFFPISIVEVGMLYLSAKLCKQAISSRERVRYKQAEMYYHFKTIVKKIGAQFVEEEKITTADDLFFMSYKEIGELLSSSAIFSKDIKELIIERRTRFNIESNNEYPENFTTNFGERPESIKEEVSYYGDFTEFNGLAVSGGRIKARVKVLESVLESAKLNKGDILVTKQTDPGWAMVFPLIGGLIVERGGALSHGAIVAREFGIPAVIGIANITEILSDNDEVILDGDLGKIQLL
ncbi:PEP/pyruvate-binding domain-containing protein [Aestuariivivens sp. NBU2969]|uniref:PEP/pyruvate-binding domain-containing protein n=1 Tax=Aestuariivivens sp. NBU2969 TaxID=2873267 RepID=UPI001CBAB5A8|nr:PEP/pyruvate-binding domain-containing protein [Aestuariivivens sp. NBU2969]